VPCIDGVTVSDGWIPLVDFMRPSILWNLCILFVKKKRRFYIIHYRNEVYYEEEETYYEEEEMYFEERSLL
jgi:hypothetical protein